METKLDGMISVWVDIENYNKYRLGAKAVSWEAPGKNERINLIVPLNHVDGIYDNGSEGYEIDIIDSSIGIK
ncbi:hypothetical protein [Bacillus phage vB_BtM_BMBsp2]|nr:hypothetical protein [Bacillus phage vB_BtM_BMBsp2]